MKSAKANPNKPDLDLVNSKVMNNKIERAKEIENLNFEDVLEIGNWKLEIKLHHAKGMSATMYVASQLG